MYYIYLNYYLSYIFNKILNWAIICLYFFILYNLLLILNLYLRDYFYILYSFITIYFSNIYLLKYLYILNISFFKCLKNLRSFKLKKNNISINLKYTLIKLFNIFILLIFLFENYYKFI